MPTPEKKLSDPSKDPAKCSSTKTKCPPGATATTKDSPAYEPKIWNKAKKRTSTNCYAYAANDPNGHPNGGKPQPGVKCGSPISSVDCASVDAASRCDGMIKAPNPPPAKTGFYPVALVVDPGVDYHWYRLDDNGKWSHKPGHGKATNLDASGKAINNPEHANRDYGRVNYRNFCGYYYVPKGGMATKP